MTELDWLTHLAGIEESIYYATPTPRGVSPFHHLPGTVPLLISAPHSAIHMRNGRLKRADGFTGAMAHLLATETNAHALYSSYRLSTDPNYDVHSPYKSLLGRIVRQHKIQFVLDLHGMSNWHRIGAALGTMNGRSCPSQLPIIETILKSHGFAQVSEKTAKRFKGLKWRTFVTDHSRFTGGIANNTITRFVVDKLGIYGIQIELCSTIRVVYEESPTDKTRHFRGNVRAICQSVCALRDIILTLSTHSPIKTDTL